MRKRLSVFRGTWLPMWGIIHLQPGRPVEKSTWERKEWWCFKPASPRHMNEIFLGGKNCKCKGRESDEAACATFKIHIQHTRSSSLLWIKRSLSLEAVIFKVYRQKNQTQPEPGLREVSCWRKRTPSHTPPAERGLQCGNWNPGVNDKNQKTKKQRIRDKHRVI